MNLDHDTLVWVSKTFGLAYMVALSAGVVLYAYWPGNKPRFDRTAEAVLRDDEDRPCR